MIYINFHLRWTARNPIGIIMRTQMNDEGNCMLSKLEWPNFSI